MKFTPTETVTIAYEKMARNAKPRLGSRYISVLREDMETLRDAIQDLPGEPLGIEKEAEDGRS